MKEKAREERKRERERHRERDREREREREREMNTHTEPVGESGLQPLFHRSLHTKFAPYALAAPQSHVLAKAPVYYLHRENDGDYHKVFPSRLNSEQRSLLLSLCSGPAESS